MNPFARDALIATGVVFVGSVAYVLATRGSSKGAPPPSGGVKPPQPPTPPPATPTHWPRVETIQPGKATRISFPGYLLAPVLAAAGSGAQDMMLQRWFGGVVGVFGAALGPAYKAIGYWGPLDALPSDWPKDDPNVDGYRVQYAASPQTAPIDVASLPPGGVVAWQYV